MEHDTIKPSGMSAHDSQMGHAGHDHHAMMIQDFRKQQAARQSRAKKALIML